MSLLNADGTPIEPADVRTKSGLVVPSDSVDRERRVVTNDEWKKWRRTIRSAAAMGLQTMFMCMECKAPAMPQEKTKTLQCNCSTWELPIHG